MEFHPNSNNRKVNSNYIPPASIAKCLNPLERNELEKAMLGRGVDYETVQLILRDFDIRVEHLYSIVRTNKPKRSLCKLRNEDKCNDYCDGWNIYEDCYIPSE